MAVALFVTPAPIVWWPFALLLLGCAASGAASGAVGIGGVFMMPLLLIVGADAKVAAVSTLASFIIHASYTSVSYARRGEVPRREMTVMAASMFCGALGGLWLLPYVPAETLGTVVSLVALVSGVQVLWKEKACRRPVRRRVTLSVTLKGDGETSSDSEAADMAGGASSGAAPKAADAALTLTPSAAPPLLQVHIEASSPSPTTSDANTDGSAVHVLGARDTAVLALLTLFAGAGSVLTATGGPLILVPSMLVLLPKLRTTQVVGMSVTAAVITSATTTTVVIASEDLTVDVGLAVVMGVALVAGAPAGIWLAMKVSSRGLKLVIAGLLVVVGAYSLVRVWTADAASLASPSDALPAGGE